MVDRLYNDGSDFQSELQRVRAAHAELQGELDPQQPRFNFLGRGDFVAFGLVDQSCSHIFLHRSQIVQESLVYCERDLISGTKVAATFFCINYAGNSGCNFGLGDDSQADCEWVKKSY